MFKNALTYFVFLTLFVSGLITAPLQAGAAEEAADDIFSGSSQGDSVRVLLLPRKETVLSGEIAARIEKITVDFGDSFKEGQELICFDCRAAKAQLDKAKAELDEALQIDKINSRLEEFDSISEIDVAASRGKKNRALAEVSLRSTMVDHCIIKAPFSGKVVDLKVHEFEYVSPGQPLLEIIDSKNVILQMFVKSSWLQWLKKGQKFSVSVDETKSRYNATVTSIGAKVDPVSQTLEIRGELEKNNSELLAGMSGTAYFQR